MKIRSMVWHVALAVILTACGQSQEQMEDAKTPALTNSDTTTLTALADSSAKTKSLNPFAGIEDFTIDFYSPAYKALLSDLKKNTGLKIRIKKDDCGGDCCYNYNRFEEKDGKQILFVVDHTCGEYRFGNEQYYEVNNQLQKVRHFDYSLNDNGDGFTASEEIIEFTEDKAVVKKRSKNLKNKTGLSLSSLPFKTVAGQRDILLKQQTDMLFELNQAIKK